MNGASIVGEEGQGKRWVEYFEEFLNRTAPKDPVDIQPACHDLPIIRIAYAHERRNPENNHKPTAQNGSGHRYIPGDALHALHEDLGENELPAE